MHFVWNKIIFDIIDDNNRQPVEHVTCIGELHNKLSNLVIFLSFSYYYCFCMTILKPVAYYVAHVLHNLKSTYIAIILNWE